MLNSHPVFISITESQVIILLPYSKEFKSCVTVDILCNDGDNDLLNWWSQTLIGKVPVYIRIHLQNGYPKYSKIPKKFGKNF